MNNGENTQASSDSEAPGVRPRSIMTRRSFTFLRSCVTLTSLKALSGAVSYIDDVYHQSLLGSIFGMSMWNYGPDVMDALADLIISLAASSGKYVDVCLEMLVSNFIPPQLDMLKQPRCVAKKEQVMCRVHSAFKDIADLVPLAPSRLLPIIIHKMPNIFTKEPLMAIFVENMLRLEASAVGELVGRRTLIMAVVDRLIDLDVEIGWDDILSEEPTKGIFEMELEDEATAAEEDGIEFPRESLTRKSLGGNVVVDKLDSLMVLTFEHLKSCEISGRLVEVFEYLLQSFQVTVLNVYKSKFAQFVMFYACSLDPENCGVRFAKLLANIFVCSDSPPLTRQEVRDAARAYIGDTGLLDFVLKSLGNHVVGNYLVRRSLNPVTKVLEYCLEDISTTITNSDGMIDSNGKFSSSKITRFQLSKDIFYLYRCILKERKPGLSSSGMLTAVPLATRIVLDCKHLVKEFRQELPSRAMEGTAEIFCTLQIKDKDGQPIPVPKPPPELFIIRGSTTISELKREVEKRFREVYLGLRSLQIESIVNSNARENDFVCGEFEEGGELVFECGVDTEELLAICKSSGPNGHGYVECACGVKDDDGERMVACDICEVWQHTRCVRIPNSEEIPRIYLCNRCEQDIIFSPLL
ncbi:hypothetical protein Nepgr_001704 [Nepenthes gracilis]|uniref:Zinc finger PHD-type domain-containing protein n=1 Tax=Nepenthes gracilis TaxID=150966 RepID=A0AAD3P2Z2_NEPGR|nr:hypothetical protein Nepgr_001704 [Nepenthes gracilis]